MTARSAFRLGQGIGGLVAIVILICVFAADDLVRLTADEQNRDAAVWLYDNDAAPGQTLGGRAWVDAGDIESVKVYHWGPIDQVDHLGDTWVAERQRGPAQDFAFEIPTAAGPGDTLELEIEIWREQGMPISLKHRLALVSRGVSALRRLGKGVLALALLAGLTAAVFGLKRRALQRSNEESPLWVIPAVVIGWVSFVPLLEQATRLHGNWFYVVALAVWAVAAFAIAERLNRRIGLVSYKAVPILVDMEGHEAFREANVSAPIRPIDDLENAWSAVGLVVRRAGRELLVTGPGKRFAVVPVPASEVVGGAPLMVRTNDPEFADLLVAAASDVLGELRIE